MAGPVQDGGKVKRPIHHTSITVDAFGKEDVTLDLDYRFYPSFAGDRIDPPEAADIDIISASVDGDSVNLDGMTEAEYEKLVDKMIEQHEERIADEMEAADRAADAEDEKNEIRRGQR